jgi:predicted flavoprotein YhiN
MTGRIAIIGGGPAGLMAAEVLASLLMPGSSPSAAVNPKKIEIFESMPSVGRKFLMAGKGA